MEATNKEGEFQLEAEAPSEGVQTIRPEDLILDDEADSDDPTQRVVAAVRVERPRDGHWFRCHPEHKARMGLFRDDAAGVTYAVAAPVYKALASDPAIKAKTLFLCQDSAGQLYLWPVSPLSDYRRSPYTESAYRALERAKTEWVRVDNDQRRGEYAIRTAQDSPGEPEWPTESIGELITIAFAGRVVDSLEHPVVRKLQGHLK